jgi:hypothetical protein
MIRVHALGLVLVLGVAVLGVMAVARDLDPRVGRGAASIATDRVPLLGVIGNERKPGSLVRLGPRTLRPISRPLRLRGYRWATAWSPDRRRLALGLATYERGRITASRIQVVDVRRWRTAAVIDVSPHTEVQQLAWSVPDRLVALMGQRGDGHAIVVVDPAARRVVRQARISGMALGDRVWPTADGLVALMAPAEAIGPASLAIVSSDGAVRRVVLEGIEAGFDAPSVALADNRSFPVARRRFPGLAIDPAATRAYVVAADRPAVVEVDLASGDATPHELTEAQTVLGWLHDLLESPAEAKGAEGPYRQAHLITRDVLAVTGYNESMRDHRQEQRPYGLRLIETRHWSVRTVDERVASFHAAPRALVVGDGGYGQAGGVVVFDPDGSKRFRRFEGRDVWVQTAGRWLYAQASGRTHAIDLTTGHTVRMLRGDPPTLIPSPVG